MTRLNRKKKKWSKKTSKTYKTLNTMSGIAHVASTALNLAKFVATAINSEDKYVDTSMNFQPNIALPAQLVTNLIAQGTDNTQRVGRQIRLKSLHLRLNITAQAGSAAVSYLKYFIVFDKKHSGALVFPLAEYLTANDEISFRNINFHNRFHTIKQRHIKIIKNAPNQGVYIDDYIDLTKSPFAKTEFDGIGGTLGDISAFPLYIVYVSSAAAGAEVDIRGQSRVRYIDN